MGSRGLKWPSQAVLDLGGAGAKLKRIPPSPESDLSAPLKKLLTYHPRVAWATRLQTGKGFFLDYATMQSIIAALGGQEAFEARFRRPQWLEFGTPGAPDFIGQLKFGVGEVKAGALLAIETKPRPYVPSQVSTHQRSFLAMVNKHGGLGLVADNIGRVDAVLSGREEPESTGLGYFV